MSAFATITFDSDTGADWDTLISVLSGWHVEMYVNGHFINDGILDRVDYAIVQLMDEDGTYVVFHLDDIEGNVSFRVV